jgi:hypothetical protein
MSVAPSATLPGPSASLPTATPRPRETPVPVTGIEDIVDVWWVFDAQAGGPNHINFNADGTYRVAHGPYPGITRAEGTFDVDGDVLTFHNGWFGCREREAGSYQLELLGDTMLTFLPMDEECAERLSSTFRIWATWQRGRPPQT